MKPFLRSLVLDPGRRFALLVALGLASLAIFHVRDLRHPLLIPTDPGVYRFAGFYFGRNFHPLPLPSLTLDTDWTLYPYGIDHTFLHWAFERDVAVSLASALWGVGPWLQLYFLVSVAVTAIASYLLLRREYGAPAASVASLALTFFNFYALNKFPGQQPFSCVHWAVLGIVADSVLARRVWERRPLGVRLLTARAALLGLGLGLDPGYFAGFGLTSFFLTVLWSLGVVLVRGGADRARLGHVLGELFGGWRRDLRRHPRGTAALLLVALLAVWLYVPLLAELRSHVEASGLGDRPRAVRWDHPVRLLLPILPGFGRYRQVSVLGDRGETWNFQFSPGLSFVLAAVAGLALGGRRVGRVAPQLALFLLLVLYRPGEPGPLQILPWFELARTAGRASAVFPALLVLFALQIPGRLLKRRGARIAAAALALLFVVESTVAFGLIAQRRDLVASLTTTPDPTLLEAMTQIRAMPGEAIFEWPFAVAPDGGRLGVFASRIGSWFQLAELHHKKGMSLVFGRMDPHALDPAVEAGWPSLFFPTDGPPTRRRQRRDLTPDEWAFLTAFVRCHDFCAVFLYTELLPPETIEGFHRRFGPPAIRLTLTPGPGKVEVLPLRLDSPGS